MSALVLAEASAESIGRELARRVEQRHDAAKGAAHRSRCTEDLVEIADAAETALWAASQASDMAVAARMLIGSGDVELSERTSRLAKEAAACAAYAQTRWGLIRRRRGLEARA